MIENWAASRGFQPVVRLDTREVVAYHARCETSQGSELGPGGRCPAASPLLVAAAPASGVLACPDDLRSIGRWASDRLRLVMTLRGSGDPLALLTAAESLRSTGCGIALSNLDLDPAALALLPLLRPDIVRIGSRLLDQPWHAETLRMAAAVGEYAERSGASVLADGIETTQQLLNAKSLGASLGRGGLLGVPAAMANPIPVPLEPVSLPGEAGVPSDEPGTTPYDVVALARQVTLTDKAALLALCRRLRVMALDAQSPPVVLGCFQDAAGLALVAGGRFTTLAERASLVVAFGIGLPEEPVARVRGIRIDSSDLLSDEWNLVVLGPGCAAALVARDLGDAGPDLARRYVHAVTFDRDLVIAAARPLLSTLVRSQGREPGCTDLLTVP